MENISNFNPLKFKKKSERALMTEVSKLKNGFEKNLQDGNVFQIKQLQMENENLKLKLDYFRGAITKKNPKIWDKFNIRLDPPPLG